MFTGLIEQVGDVEAVTPTEPGFRLTIRTALAADLRTGDSVAVNGVCLTVVECGASSWRADIGPETARVTTLGRLVAGDRVNLERSMRADGRFGGHFVQGHVDGTGVVQALQEEGESHWIRIGIPPGLEAQLVAKGSIAVDGVSLTVARLDEASFEVMIIPFTWAQTTLSDRRVGDLVNLECDMVGKYVARAMALAARGGRTT
jgi:riboflavin synthase